MTYFLAVYHRQRVVPDLTQVREARLMPFSEAMAALAFPGARRVLQLAEDWLNSHP